MTAQGPVGWMTLMSIRKHLTKKGAPAKLLHLWYLSFCAPKYSVRFPFIWGKHLSLFRKVITLLDTFLSDTIAFRKVSLCKVGHLGMLQGVTSEAKPSNVSFCLGWLLSLSLTPHSQYRSDSLKQLLDFQKCSSLPSPTERGKWLLWILCRRTDVFQYAGY